MSDPITSWRTYIDQLAWAKGSLDDAGYRAFLRAGSLGISEQVAFDEVICRIVDAGARPRIAKLQRQLASAYARAGSKAATGSVSSSYSSPAKWPAPDLDAIQRVISAGLGLYDLWEASPIHWNDGESHAEQIIDALFRGDPLLCTALAKDTFATKHREQWRGQLSARAYIVPNPMLSIEGLTQDGKKSQHRLEATGRRVYQVIEFDFQADHPLIAEWNASGNVRSIYRMKAAGVNLTDVREVLAYMAESARAARGPIRYALMEWNRVERPRIENRERVLGPGRNGT
jgi:hypothetical protein